jgi:cytochrome o ubiquinol oxidase subunit I
MGAGAAVNTFFGIASSVIAVGTGVKIYNWIFTMYGGRVRFETPMLWSMGFIFTFIIGGLTGVLLAVPPVDFVLHNSTFLVAHFHNVIISGVVFGVLAGINYWFPKAFGFTLDERFGHASFWCWLIGFYCAFMPLYALGLMGMTRRLEHIPDPNWRPLLLVAEAGAIVIFCGILCQIAQLYVSIRTRERRLDLTGDPWNGRTLEWSTSSPPPAYNFAVLPRVETIDAFWHMKRVGRPPVESAYEAIELPRNSPAGFITAFFATIMGFSLIWQIWWLAILGFLAAITVVLIAGWSIERETEISAAEVAQMEQAR